MTLMGLYTFVAGTMIGAFALDYTYLEATKTQLQVAADQAAHAALYNRRSMSEEDAKKVAIELIQPLLPSGRYGRILTTDSIEFGTFDRESAVFTAEAGSGKAVRVKASMTEVKDNAAPSYLFKMLGKDHFDVAASSVFMTYMPGCLKEGIMADGVVDLQSNNSFSNGFCIHSNSHVSINQNNYFEPGTVVSMPNITDLDMPRSGFEKNTGLQEALRDQRMNLNILNRLEGIQESLASGKGARIPGYITSATTVPLQASSVQQSMLTPGRIYRIDCKGQSLDIDGATAPIQNVVILTTCPVKFANGSKLFDAVILTTSTDVKSVTAPQGLQIGKNDNCAAGGGAQIITLGGVSVASKLSMFGGQILAKKDVDFAANADGLQGASIVTRGKIDGTSNSRMGFCLSGMEQNFETDYYRMAQ
ncbi:hypothetical protein GLR48_08375 [Loktanella sp. M215]|nr:hypothetical protein [Loktanella sp. M215]